MMLDQRERPSETPITPAQAQQCRRRAWRDRLFGLWVAGRLDLENDEAARYAADLVGLQAGQGDDRRILAKAARDLTAAGHVLAPELLAAELARYGRAVHAEPTDAVRACVSGVGRQ